MGKDTAAQLLGCTKRTLETYVKQFVVYKTAGLVDHRKSNNHKLSESQKAIVIQLKQTNPWRSPRNIRDHLSLPVTSMTIRRLLCARGLARENLKRVKAIVRFEAENPNDMWQTDIMGKISFAYLGDLYLIATLDDHSRFVPYGKW